MGKTPKKRLKAEQRTAFAREAARLIVKERMQQREALLKACEVLPADKRQSNYAGIRISYKSWLPHMLEAETERLRLLEAAEQAQAPATPPEPESLPEPEPVMDISAFGTDDLVRELIARIITNVSIHLEQSIRDALTPVPIEIPQTSAGRVNPVKRKERQIRIGIAGLLPQQQQIIKKEFGDEIDVRFLRQQGNDLKFFGNYDHVLCMRGAMSHGQTDKIKSMKIPYTLCSGMSDLKEKLTGLWVQNAEKGGQNVANQNH